MSDKVYKGSCLCGELAYEIEGEPIRFYHCHCQRCRKATGSAHASNMFIKSEKINWLKGENRLASYKVPEAERFTNSFCSQCGSRMPRYVAELNVVMLPAGSLDSEPPIKPQANIFWDSRPDWGCVAGDVPVYPEYVTDK